MITVRVTQASAARFKANLKAYEKRAGKSREETIKELSKAAAKQLASKVQPYGLNARVGKKFQESIKNQVWRAVRNAQIAGDASGVSSAHTKRRNSRGQVPKGLQSTGAKYAMKPYSVSDVESVATRKSEKAGTLKSGWISAGEKLSNSNISGVAKWISKHSGIYGDGKIRKTFNDVIGLLTNNIDYIRSAQSMTEINSALKTAYNGYGRKMMRELEKSHTATP